MASLNARAQAAKKFSSSGDLVLAVNIGNTTIALSFYEFGYEFGHEVGYESDGDVRTKTRRPIFRVSSKCPKTTDEYECAFRALLPPEDCARCALVAVCSVVPEKTPLISAALQRVISRAQMLPIRHGLALPIPRPIAHMGLDLVANAVSAAAKSNGRANITADFGTALTLTAVRADGIIAGVSIGPGVGTSLASLAAGASQLTLLPLEQSKTALGTTTASALNAGFALGFRHMVTGLVAQMKKEMGSPNARVFATGGDARLIAEGCAVFDAVDEHHTLDGIFLIARRNISLAPIKKPAKAPAKAASKSAKNISGGSASKKRTT